MTGSALSTRILYNDVVAGDISRSQPTLDRWLVEAAVEDILRAEPAVVAAYVFGSVSRGTAGPLSDVDVALLIPDRGERQGVCDRTMDAVCRRLGTPHVDVISLADAPLPLQYRVAREGRRLLCRDAALVERFVTDTVLHYLDFRPLRDRAFARLRDGILEGH